MPDKKFEPLLKTKFNLNQRKTCQIQSKWEVFERKALKLVWNYDPSTDPPTHPLTSVCSRSPAKKPCSRSLSVWKRNKFYWQHHHFHHNDLHHDHRHSCHHLNVIIHLLQELLPWEEREARRYAGNSAEKRLVESSHPKHFTCFLSLIWKLCQQICL